MLSRRAIRAVAVPLAIFAMLLIVSAAGGLLHHHDQASDSHCQICHLVHQVIEQPLAGQLASLPAVVGSHPLATDSAFYASPISRPGPTRAPPSA
jgi:hypothetical protein